MTIEMMRQFLGWCTVIDVGLMLSWFLFFWLCHDWMFRFHGKMFKMSEQAFDTTHYAGMAIFKLGIWLFNLTPYLALSLLR